MRHRIVLVAAVSSITGLVIALFLFFNIGNVRTVFAAGHTYYSRASGNWNDKNTWSTSSIGGSAASAFPQEGDIVIISGFTVSVNSDAKAQTVSVLQDKNKSTIFEVTSGKKLEVSGDISIVADEHQQPLTFQVSGEKTAVIIGGDLLLDKTKGSSKDAMNLTVSNSSSLTVAGSLHATYYKGDDNVYITISDNAKLDISEDIILDAEKGKDNIIFALKDNAIVNVDGDIQFSSLRKGQVFYTMEDNAKTILGGDIFKDDAGKLYGSLEMTEQSQLVLAGESNQYINGNVTGGDIFTVTNLTINTPGNKNIALNGDVRVTGALTFINGVLETNSTGKVILASTATSSGSSQASYIDGPVIKEGNTAFTFPIGKDGKYAPLSIAAPTANSTFKAEYFNTPYTNLAATTVQSPLANVSKVEYWQLDRMVGTGLTSVKLHWTDTEFSGISSTADLYVASLNTAAKTWSKAGNSVSSQEGATQGSVASQNMSNFGAFTFGSGGTNALPVSLVSWDAKAKADYVQLSWATATEINNDFFTIERSSDGRNFAQLSTIKGAGNANEILKYAFEDNDPMPGTSYYRLKQTDFNGQFEYFDIKAVNISVATINNVGPNPFNSSFTLNYNLVKDAEVDIQLIGSGGNIVHDLSQNGSRGNNSIVINNQQHLTKGIYILRINCEGQQVSYKLVKN